MWATYSVILEEILLESCTKLPSDRYIEQNTRDLRYILSDHLSDIKKRNEAMLFRGPIAQVSARLGSAVSDVKVRLNCR